MDMNPTKALEPDGLPALFYQKLWDIVGPDITKALKLYLNKAYDWVE